MDQFLIELREGLDSIYRELSDEKSKVFSDYFFEILKVKRKNRGMRF